MTKINVVCMGGGVLGIEYGGAYAVMAAHGYEVDRWAGTSAGAIIATLGAAGFTPDEIVAASKAVDYRKFMDHGHIPFFDVIDDLRGGGLYRGDYFENWMRGLLASKGVHTFRDLRPGCLQVIASDITRGRLLVLPQDISDYGIDPMDLDVALATRYSMGIPLFFMTKMATHPVFGKCAIVDGGVSANFPLGLFKNDPTTWGFRFAAPEDSLPHNTETLVQQAFAVFSFMRHARDDWQTTTMDKANIVNIPTLGISAIDFGLSEADQARLLQSGKDAVGAYFKMIGNL